MPKILPSPHRPEAIPGRVLHLIDVENLLAGPNFGGSLALRGRAAYDAVAPIGVVNQVVVSTSHRAAPSAWFAWPQSARRLVRSGPDGADSALIDIVACERLERRFDRIVIGSGDGIFAFPAARLQAAGCPVTVVTRPECLSRALRLAVRDVRFIATAQQVISRGAIVA
jgi:hypothetical protein